MVVVLILFARAGTVGIIDVGLSDVNNGVGVGEESVKLVEAGLDLLEAVVTGGDGGLEGTSFVLEVSLEVGEVGNLKNCDDEKALLECRGSL